jgi:hypothetical protein
MKQTQTKKQPDLPTYLNYNKLVFHEGLWPDVIGKTLTIDFKRGELVLKAIEGIWSCRITFAEGIAFKSKLELSHMADWVAEYHPPVGVMVLDGNSWYLKLYNGRKLLKETHGCNGLPPGRQWNAFYSVITRMCTIAQVRGILRSDEAMERPCFSC